MHLRCPRRSLSALGSQPTAVSSHSTHTASRHCCTGQVAQPACSVLGRQSYPEPNHSLICALSRSSRMLMAVPTTGRLGRPFMLRAGALRKARTCAQRSTAQRAGAGTAQQSSMGWGACHALLGRVLVPCCSKPLAPQPLARPLLSGEEWWAQPALLCRTRCAALCWHTHLVRLPQHIHQLRHAVQFVLVLCWRHLEAGLISMQPHDVEAHTRTHACTAQRQHHKGSKKAGRHAATNQRCQRCRAPTPRSNPGAAA